MNSVYDKFYLLEKELFEECNEYAVVSYVNKFRSSFPNLGYIFRGNLNG